MLLPLWLRQLSIKGSRQEGIQPGGSHPWLAKVWRAMQDEPDGSHDGAMNEHPKGRTVCSAVCTVCTGGCSGASGSFQYKGSAMRESSQEGATPGSPKYGEPGRTSQMGATSLRSQE